ncbi:MAG: DUF1735 domain-containing protein [Bacteroidales bacterium]|nr:DUF1735 domain-containing protein [Bacteroidales bacterium]
MKRLFILIFLIGLLSCENQEVDFPDFEYTSGYFPYQYPIRTLVLGDYIYDNTNDNNHKFVVSATMGGVYENKETRVFKYIVDESLCTNAFFEDGSPIRPLPKSYYQLSNEEEIIIEPGSITGGVEVQLTDDFFNDPRAIRNTYVLPLRLTGVINLDTLVQGKSASLSADPRVASDWEILPKHFTMFGVKYINPFHGKFLYFGASSVSQNNTVLESNTYSTQYIEQNEVLKLNTTGRTQVSMIATFKASTFSGNFEMLLNFASENYDSTEGVACTIEQAKGTPYTIQGTGKYMSKTEEWGNKQRDAIYLSYTVDDDVNVYSANDTLVLRDRDVVMEVYSPTIKIP